MKYVNIHKNKIQNEKPKKRKKPTSKTVAFILGILVLGATLFLFRNDVKAIFDPVSIVANISEVDLKETDGRTNVLLLGSDRRQQDERNATLTDTMLVASIGRVEKDVIMISLPRDLWVESDSGYYTKINEIYAKGGGDEAIDVVGDVLGIPIHYYAVVDFEIFKESIDILGGIEVDVENSFVDTRYPVAGKENAPFDERYETVSFEKGTQTMDGETALKFARSRKGNNNEGTDFARSARQQKVILAIKDKALSLDTLINPKKLKDLYSTYAENVDTNVTFKDAQNFYLLSQQIDFQKFKTIVLDDRSASAEGGLLYAPEDRSLYNNKYVLLPRSGDFSQIHAYVQKYIFGN